MPEDTAPGSPPDLTNSKSSKSSSYQSSALSEVGGPTELSHFEDIGLEQEQQETSSLNKSAHTANTRIKRHPEAVSGQAAPRRPPPRPAATTRDLTATSRPQYPNLAGQVHGALRSQGSLHAPNKRGMRRGFTSPSTPTFSAIQNRSRSPSPQPQAHQPFRTSPLTFSRSNSSASSNGDIPLSPGAAPLGRRQSWQPTRRKTVSELEAEIDDGDEDLPEDIVLANVPISPRPPYERSPSRSPERQPAKEEEKDPQPKSGDLKQFRRASGRMSPPRAVPVFDDENRSPTSATAPGFPAAMPPRPRTKSWNVAYSELTREAQSMTRKLERWESDRERTHEKMIQKRAATANEKPMLNKHASYSVVELRTGNPLIDPLPPSKEKLRHLSYTRDPWLPPKSKKEDEKHRKEIERIMASISKKGECGYESQTAKANGITDQEKAEKIREDQARRDSMQASISNIWKEHIIPNWDAVITQPSTRELWWHGVTPASRSVVWPRQVGNELCISSTTFDAALRRAQVLESQLANVPHDERTRSKEHTWFQAIKRDAARSFPELGVFHAGGPLNADLEDVLKAYAMYRSDVGYVYGTHLIAALLVLNLPSPASAFITLANLLNRPTAMAFLVDDRVEMQRTYACFYDVLQKKMPRLHEHIVEKLRLSAEDFLDPMFRTLFCAKLNVDVVSRVWDVHMFEGSPAIIRTAVGVMMALEGSLYGSREEFLDILGWHATKPWKVGTEDGFMEVVRKAGKA